MLWNFIRDGQKAIRLRFHPLSGYHYHISTLVGMNLCLGFNFYLTFYSIFGDRLDLLGVCVLTQILRCTVLSETMVRCFDDPAIRRENMYSFIILTESLSLILILFFLLPSTVIFQTISFFLSLWFLLVQVAGLLKFGQVKVFKLLLFYLLYMILFFIVTMFVLFFAASIGVITENDLITIEQYQKNLVEQ